MFNLSFRHLFPGLIKLSPAAFAAAITLSNGVVKAEIHSPFYFIADADVDEIPEAYYYDPVTHDRVKVNKPLPVGGAVESIKVDGKGKFAVYRADNDTDGQFELYLANKSGFVGKVNGPLIPDGDTFEYAIDARGRSVFYTADAAVDFVSGLFRRDIKTGVVENLLESYGPLIGVRDFLLHPKKSLAFIVSDFETDNKFELFQLDLKTKQVIKINDPVGEQPYIAQYFLDAAGANLYYRVYEPFLGTNRLYGYNIKTGLNTPVSDPAIDDAYSLVVDKKNQKAMFLSSYDQSVYLHLYNPATGISVVEDILPSPKSYQNLTMDPMGRFAIATTDREVSGNYQLVKIDASTGDIQQLTNLSESGDVEHVGMDPKGKFIYYVATDDGTSKLYQMDTVNFEATPLSQITNGWVLDSGLIDNKNKKALYLSGVTFDNFTELTFVDLKTGERYESGLLFNFFTSITDYVMPRSFIVYND